MQAGEPLRRAREVVEQLRDVVEADGENRLVGVVLPRDALPGDLLLPGGPAPERDVHHLDPPPLRAEPGFEPLRVRLFRTDLRPERHAVPEDRDPPIPLGLLVCSRPVPETVAVELLPGRPARRVRLHHVEAARHHVVPVPDVVGDLLSRRARPLQQAGAPLEDREEDDHRSQAQRDVDEEAAPQAATARRSVASIRSQCVPRQKSRSHSAHTKYSSFQSAVRGGMRGRTSSLGVGTSAPPQAMQRGSRRERPSSRADHVKLLGHRQGGGHPDDDQRSVSDDSPVEHLGLSRQQDEAAAEGLVWKPVPGHVGRERRPRSPWRAATARAQPRLGSQRKRGACASSKRAHGAAASPSSRANDAWRALASARAQAAERERAGAIPSLAAAAIASLT